MHHHQKLSAPFFLIDGTPDIQPVTGPPKAMLEGSHTSPPIAGGDQDQAILREGSGEKLTDHKIHPFKVNNLVVWGTFQELCDHHHDLIIGHFHHHKKKPYPH